MKILEQSLLEQTVSNVCDDLTSVDHITESRRKEENVLFLRTRFFGLEKSRGNKNNFIN